MIGREKPGIFSNPFLRKIRGEGINKKGVFFMLLAMLLVTFFLISFTLFSVIKDRSAVQKRVETMNSFVFSLGEDISRQMQISGFRALLAVEQQITSSGIFVGDAEGALEEVLFNGTVNGNNVSLMIGFTLPEWNARVLNLSNKMNIDANYSVENISVSQSSPWNVRIDMDIRLVLNDRSGLASWDRNETVSGEVSIEGFEDVLYLVNTNGLVANKIVITPYENFAEGNDVLNLTNHTEESYYVASSSAPSFLDRLEGKTSANANGIESLVNLEKLSNQGVSVLSKSVVDYIYFSSSDPESFQIAGMPSWFRLDNSSSHLEFYQVSDLVI